MASGKYEHLLKPLKIAEMPGIGNIFRNTGNADVNRWLNGRDHMDGVKLNFSWGFYTGLGDWHPGMDPHVHPYPECLVFVGLDPHRPEHLGAKLQYCLGKELEIHQFDKPTCVVAPAGFYHCPSVTLDVTSPVGYSFFIISLGPDPTSRWLGDGLSDEQMMARETDANASDRPSPMNSSFGKKRVHVAEDTVSHGHLYDDYLVTMKPNTFNGHRLSGERKALYGDMAGGEWKPGPGLNPDAVWLFGQDLLDHPHTTRGLDARPGDGRPRPSGRRGARLRWDGTVRHRLPRRGNTDRSRAGARAVRHRQAHGRCHPGRDSTQSHRNKMGGSPLRGAHDVAWEDP
jgi:hypothetical protein